MACITIWKFQTKDYQLCPTGRAKSIRGLGSRHSPIVMQITETQSTPHDHNIQVSKMARVVEKSELSAAERIAQLNSIDKVCTSSLAAFLPTLIACLKDVAKLLHSAGLAIKTLTSSALEADGSQGSQNQDMEQRKENFAAASGQYFSLLSSIDVRLRRQISALEAAEIIPSETTAKESQISPQTSGKATHTSNSLLPQPAVSSKDTITNGGLGNLDVSWLNCRNNKVEKEMEAELWEEALELVHKISETKAGNEVATTLQ
ncbi:MAG: hypothetical protein Q9181_003446 [Wetmoreana brouardii]